MKKAASFLLALLLCALCSCDSHYGVIVRIEFSGEGKSAEARHISYDLSAVREKELSSLPLLKNINPYLDYDKLLAAFQMEGAEYTKFSDPSGRKYKQNEKTLVVYRSGLISFTDTSRYGKVNTILEKQMRLAATELAEAAGLDVSELVYGETVLSEESATVVFSRRINGVETVGRTGMSVTFNGDGVSGFSYLCTAYGIAVEQELISVSEACDLLLTDKSSQTFGRETGVKTRAIETVIVSDVTLVYWDSAYTQTRMYQTHIQPVYRFEGVCIDSIGGKTVFTGYVRAVSDKVTANFHVDDDE